MPIPAVDFSEEIDKSMYIGDILNKELKIYVTPTEFFTTKFREIIKKTQITFKTAKYGRKWVAGPDLSCWPQQLNFALWCATTGCGISRDILFLTRYLNLSPQVRSFYLFHVYFTMRRILYEIGGIESVPALICPTIPHSNSETTNTQSQPTKKSVVSSVSTQTLTSASHMEKTTGLALYTWVTYSGPEATDYHYPDPDLAMFDDERQTDITKDDYKANGIYYVRNDQGADKRFEYFVPNYS